MWLCIGITVFAASASHFFFTLPSGLLFLHFVAIDCLSSDASFSCPPTLLLPFAALLMIAEQCFNVKKKEITLSRRAIGAWICGLLLLDAGIWMGSKIAHFEITLILFVALIFAGFVGQQDVRPAHSLPLETLVQVGASDLFQDPVSRLSCFGKLSMTHFCILLMSLPMQLDLLRTSEILLLWNSLRGICTLSLILNPSLVGGTIHALKAYSRKITAESCSIVHA